MAAKNPFLDDARRVKPFSVGGVFSVAETLKKMEDISFQGRSLGAAFRIWQDALKDRTSIFLGLSGAMVPAGMRKVIVEMIEKRLIDCVVSTGANLFHDSHETLGRFHFKCSPFADDVELNKFHVDRMYDVAANEEEFDSLDRFIGEFCTTLERRPYTTREFFNLFGLYMAKQAKEEGILTAAAKAGIPVYSPAIGDSSFGIAFATHYRKESEIMKFDIVEDVREMAKIVAASPAGGVVFIGGGTPKNFTQQAEVTARILNEKVEGYKYCIQITTDAPHWGGLSGCTFEESQSWGKIHHKAEKVAVYADATIVLPLLVTGLVEVKAHASRKYKPSFKLGKTLAVEFPRDGK